MDNIIFSQITTSEFAAMVRLAVREEIINLQASQYGKLNVDKTITTKELCAHLNITEPTVIRWRKKNKIPFLQIGSAVRFNLHDVLKSLEK